MFLPYKYVIGKMVEKGLIKKISNLSVGDSTIFSYLGDKIEEDIKSLKKKYYIVSSSNYNLLKDWLQFDETILDLSKQSKEKIIFYIPFYNSVGINYLNNLKKINIKKQIICYPPEKHLNKEDAKKSLSILKEIGFEYSFSEIGNHAKVFIFDNKVALIGSFNFTSKAIYENNELGVLIFDKEVDTLLEFLKNRI